MSEVDSTLSPPQAPYSRPPDVDAHDQYPHHPVTTASQRQHYLSHYSHRTPSAGGARTRETSWVSTFQRPPPQQLHNHFLPNANHHYANGVGHGAPPPPGPINVPPPAPIARGRSEAGSLAYGRTPTGFDAQEEYMNIDADGIARDGNGYGIPRVPVPPVPPPRTPPSHPLASSSTPALLDGNGAVYPHPMEVEAPRNPRKKKGGGGFVGGFFMGLLRGKSKKLKKKESIRGGRQITRLDDEDLVVEDGDGAGPSNADEVTTPGGGIAGRPPQYSSQPSTPVTNHVPTAIPYGTTTAPTVTTVPGTVGGGGDHISMPIPEIHEPASPPPSNASTPTPIGRRPSLRVHPPSDPEDGMQRRDSMFSRPRTESEHPLPSSRHTSTMRHEADTPRRRVHSEGEVETLHRGHGRRDTRTTQTSQSTANRTYTTENTGRSGRSSGSPGGRETRRRRQGGGARRGVDEDDEDGVYQPNLQTTEDYRSMPRGADADSVATKNGALKLQQFFRDLAKLPWIRRHRITDDYQPHARADSRAHRPSKGGKRIIVVDEPVNWRKPTRWYYDVLPEGQKHSVDVDLTGGGPSSGGYTDSRSSRTHTLGSGSDRSREYERRRRHSDEHDQRRARDREHDRDRHRDRDRDRERRSPHSSSDHTISSPPPRRRENVTSTSTTSPRRHPHDQRISDSTASSNVRSPPARDGGGHRTHKRRQHHSPPPPVPPIPPMHQTPMHHMPHMSSMNALNAPPGYATQPVVYAPALIPYGPMAQAFASPMPMQQYHPGQPQMPQQQQPIVIARSHDSPIPNVVNVNGSQAESGGGSQLMQQHGGPGGGGPPGQTYNSAHALLMSPLPLSPPPLMIGGNIPGSSTIPGGYVYSQHPQPRPP